MDMNGMKMAAALQGRGNAGRVMQGMPLTQQGGRSQPGIPNRQGMPQQPLQAGPQDMPPQGFSQSQAQMQDQSQLSQQIPPQALAAMQQMRQQGMAQQNGLQDMQRINQARQGQPMNQMAAGVGGSGLTPGGQQPFAGKPGMGSGSMPMPRR